MDEQQSQDSLAAYPLERSINLEPVTCVQGVLRLMLKNVRQNALTWPTEEELAQSKSMQEQAMEMQGIMQRERQELQKIQED